MTRPSRVRRIAKLSGVVVLMMLLVGWVVRGDHQSSPSLHYAPVILLVLSASASAVHLLMQPVQQKPTV